LIIVVLCASLWLIDRLLDLLFVGEQEFCVRVFFLVDFWDAELGAGFSSTKFCENNTVVLLLCLLELRFFM